MKSAVVDQYIKIKNKIMKPDFSNHDGSFDYDSDFERWVKDDEQKYWRTKKMKPKLIVMCGLPASGKSYQTEKLSKEYGAKIHSSDKIREEVLGDINDQSNNELVFWTLHNRLKGDLENGISCVYDACSIGKKDRMGVLREVQKIDCEKICVFMATPYEQCVKNNMERDKVVPDNVIKRMYLKFDAPGKYEGFDEIKIIWWEGSKGSLSLDGFLMGSTLQDNHHHSNTVEKHCQVVGDYVNTNFNRDGVSNRSLYIAALLHDNGKIFTKNVQDGEAHYYGHQNVGSYNSFFYDCGGLVDILYIAQLIGWHMRPLIAWDISEKSREKDKRLIGESMYQDIVWLNEADRKGK